MDCVVHGVTKSRTRLSNFHFHFQSFMILSASVVSVVMFPLSFLILFSFLFFSPLVQLKTCQYNLFTFFKKTTLSLIFSVLFLISISFVFALIFVISFLLLTLSLVCFLPSPPHAPTPISMRCEIRLSSRSHFTFFGHTWHVES